MIKLLSERTKKTIINGNCGKIEALYTKSEQLNSYASHYAIICHPHPLHGGSMNNKVVTTIAKSLDQLGISTLRFNFRGVGNSEGEFDNTIGEYEDLLAAHNWMQNKFPENPCILAGFSFGSYICCKAASTINPSALITVAPAVVSQDYGPYPKYNGAWHLIQGDKDEITDPNAVTTWAKQKKPTPNIISIAGAGHFFHGKLHELELQLTENIGTTLKAQSI